MSFFSRECLLRHHSPFQTIQALKLFFPRPRPNSSRQLSSSPLFRTVKKSRNLKLPTAKIKPSYTPTKATPGSQLTSIYKSYAETLAQKTHPTLLYQAPSQTLFVICSYAAGLFCFSYSAYNFNAHYLYPPEGLNKYVTYAFGGIVVFMSALGTWLFLGPARLIKTITAIPKSLTTQPASRLVRAAKHDLAPAATTAAPELQIEIELRKMFPVPFFPARIILAKPEDIVLEKALAPPSPASLTPEVRRLMKQAEDREKKRLMEYENNHIMTRGIRHMGRGAKQLYRATARAWFRDGFLKMGVKGGNYKLDVSGGWALDGGRALDRLAVVKGKR